MRIPSSTIEDAPEASRELLAEMVQFSPTGRLLNMHAQMAHAPAVLEAYVGMRRATAAHGSLDPPLRAALMLAAATADGNDYAQAVVTTLALRAGWRKEQVTALRTGADLGDDKTDSLISVIREASLHSGRVSDATWDEAAAQGWTADQLAEAFAYLGLTVFTSYFLNFAETDLDVPVAGE